VSSRTRTLLVAVLAIVFVGFLALAGCGGGNGGSASSSPGADEGAEQSPPAQEETSTATEGDTLYTPEYKPTGKETAVIRTSRGDITVTLYGKDAPIHVGNFIELAEKSFYDDTKFHRYVEGFVVQGGDPNTKEYSSKEVKEIAARQEQGQINPGEKALGTGGPDYLIKGEFDPAQNPNKHVEGALGMARAQSPDSAGSQFYFALQPLPQLDGNYTVFGVITDGLDVMKKLRIGDAIESVEIRGTEQ